METKKVTLSFEVFPPKTEAGYEKLCGTDGVLDKLYVYNPSSISCTYGVGGTNAGRHLDVISKIKNDGKTVPVSHYTCIGKTEEEAVASLEKVKELGITNILALRGDKPASWTERTPGMRYATELVSLIIRNFGDYFHIAVSGNPEGHVECTSIDADISYLKMKQDMGASCVNTQLCWDMEQFERWLDKIRNAGVYLPVNVGVMPVCAITGVLTQSLSHNACVMDKKLCEIITRYWINPNPYAPDDPELERKKEDFHKAGLEYTVNQVMKYRQLDIADIHLFTMNKVDDVSYVVENSEL